MDTVTKKQRIKWYRSPLPAGELAKLNQLSDWKGFVQTVGYLGILVLTGGLAWYAVGRASWIVVLLLLFLHGTVYAFLVNGFHELCHHSVFRTRWLNDWFLYIYSFLSWANHIFFWASHQEHHKYTLHPPDDLEVVLPADVKLKDFLLFAFINPHGFIDRIKSVVRLSMGIVDGEWANILFPADNPEKRRPLIRWARILLVGHGLIVVVSLYFGLWMIPVVVTLAPFYAQGFQFLFNVAQHVGLTDRVGDYRINTRTILINPVFRFLYWNMNYHIEHHMYAAVPCYNLKQLHELIEHDLPPSPDGLIETWSVIIPILRKQKIDPTYTYVPNVPGSGYQGAAAET